MESPKCCKNPIVPILSIEILPNEILMNIFSNLNIKDLYKSAHVSKKFRQISHDKLFWKCVNLSNQKVSCEFIGQILKLGTEYLNLESATLLEDSDAVIPRKNNLKYLNLASSSVSDKFLVRLLRSSVSLEKISLTGVNQKHLYVDYAPDYEEKNSRHDELMLEVRRSWYIESLLPNAKMLTSLDLSNTQSYRCRVNFESIKEIVLNCVELKEANFRNQITLEDDLEFFANNLTPKIEKLNISYNGFLYEHILPLVKRCKNITELDLYRCDLDVDRFEYHDGGPEENQNSLNAISENLSESLVKLQLPDHSMLFHDFLKSLPKLRYLWNKSKVATMIIEKYPLIVLNEGTAKIAHCANEYFEPKQGFWEVKCTAFDFSKTQ